MNKIDNWMIGMDFGTAQEARCFLSDIEICLPLLITEREGTAKPIKKEGDRREVVSFQGVSLMQNSGSDIEWLEFSSLDQLIAMVGRENIRIESRFEGRFEEPRYEIVREDDDHAYLMLGKYKLAKLE